MPYCVIYTLKPHCSPIKILPIQLMTQHCMHQCLRYLIFIFSALHGLRNRFYGDDSLFKQSFMLFVVYFGESVLKIKNERMKRDGTFLRGICRLAITISAEFEFILAQT